LFFDQQKAIAPFFYVHTGVIFVVVIFPFLGSFFLLTVIKGGLKKLNKKVKYHLILSDLICSFNFPFFLVNFNDYRQNLL
tara:strand:+ start:1521 stop:1760 length:240 start_codon:yes stop_codon:yes gene_type:complete